MFLHNLICLHTTDLRPIIVGIKRWSNSIPWCTSFHVILSLRTWHIMITTLQHARNEHRSARCVWFPNMFRFSSFCFWEYWVSRYSLCFKEEFQRYFEGLHVFHWSVENYLCARSQLQTQSMRLGNWKVHQENRNHDWSKKWLQQNSRYAVKVIAKGGFISASRSKELNLQLQLQIKFNLSMRQTILWIYPVLTHAIFKEISWPEYWSVLLNK